jgi:hypothetical protein
MPQQIRAVVVDPAVPGRLAIREVGLRDPDRATPEAWSAEPYCHSEKTSRAPAGRPSKP